MFWPFRKKEPDPDREVFERYRTDFGLFNQRRFKNYSEKSFSTLIKKRRLTFELWKANHFAWIPSDLYQYRDFCLETVFSFHPDNGHAAAGLIFRFVNDENFYYFLISNRGLFRFDALFNGHPLHLIEWTPIPSIEDEKLSLKIIAHGSHFAFFLDDEWLAEIEDEKLASGRIGIAAQNYAEKEKACFFYYSLQLESRPVEVEKLYWRWVHYIPPEPRQQLAYARTLMAMENYEVAAVQLQKALKRDSANEDILLLLALCKIYLKLYDQALGTLDNLLTLNPGHREAILEKANVLYLMNEFLKARDFVRSIIDDFKDASLLWNVLGNCEYALGNWDKAASAYRQASELANEIPLFYANQARALERCQRLAEAISAYLKAAELFFRQEAFNDLSLILPRLKALDPTNPNVEIFEAKMLFYENDKPQAKKILAKYVNTTDDSSVPYLYALILIEEGKRQEALRFLNMAAKLEPSMALYWWRIAESKRLLDLNYQTELNKALELSPEDPWVLNLQGLYLLDLAKAEEAAAIFQNAMLKAPNEIEILLNYSEALWQAGQKDKAYEIIENEIRRIDDPRLYNHKGNLLARDKEYEKAVAAYEQALRIDPANPLYIENCAASCLEAEMITRAEELLIKLIDKNPSASAYNLLGNLTALRMEYLRAELCYQEALRLAPDDLNIMLNLASLYLERSQYEKASPLINELVARFPNHPKVQVLQEKLRKRFELNFRCAQCGREWWVPRLIPPQASGKIYGQPPVESPAGRCPSCHKVYCIGCAQDALKDSRFICKECGDFLKLTDEHLRYLVNKYLTEQVNKDIKKS